MNNTQPLDSEKGSQKPVQNTNPAKEDVKKEDVKAEAAASGQGIKINLKTVIIAAIVIVVIGALGWFVYKYKSLFVAASVDSHNISRVAVVKELEKQGGKNVLDMMINKQLIANEVKAKNITVSQDEVNQEIKKYETQFNVNGRTLDDTLAAQNMTREDLKQQIVIQKEVEKLVGDQANVTDEEVNNYIKDSGITLPKGQEEQAKGQVKDQLKQQKLSDASNKLITDLRAKAKIKRFVNY